MQDQTFGGFIESLQQIAIKIFSFTKKTTCSLV